jgi:glycosyltransferase involved in cell wall biosynthesis
MKEPIAEAYDFCVLISCYNNRDGLVRSLQSICYDPVKYFVLLIDDGSIEPLIFSDLTNHLSPLLNLHVIRLPRNSGITRALNAGLHYLEGRTDFRFIARLDCGDLCSEDRFHRQVGFLDRHPDIDLVGSWCVFKDFSTGEAYTYTIPTQHKQIMRDMHFKNVFIHPTVMWRAGVAARLPAYPETFPHAEDYGFFYELLQHGKAAILPYYLMVCEISPTGLSLSHRKQQLRSRIKVVRQYRDSLLYGVLGEIRLRLLMLLPSEWALKIKKQLRNI